ncbi:hypothetical protein [Actinomycetospora flava]|uniref:Uncharacterized protein n=1 Tax=Actinomycetospora flava TaxID=3129232 RepID=A0ABU8MFH5_9PSEU
MPYDVMRQRTFEEEVANLITALASFGLFDLEVYRAREAELEDQERE